MLHVQVTVDSGWAELWAILLVQTVMEGEGDGGEEGEGCQDVLIGTLGRKGPLGSWSLVRGLTSHHIL